MYKPFKIRGLTLIELMVSIAIAMVLSIGVLYVYMGQMRTYNQVARKLQTTQEVSAAFEIITGLMRQAEMCLIISTSCPALTPITITYPFAAANPNAGNVLQLNGDSIVVSLNLPSGYNIWPNATAPYTDNAITLSWSDADGILYAQAGAQAAIALAGASGSMNTRIVNFDVWPMQVDAAGVITRAASVTDKPTAGYRIALTARVGSRDSTYTNPLDTGGPLRNYRTVTYESTILSRNW